ERCICQRGIPVVLIQERKNPLQASLVIGKLKRIIAVLLPNLKIDTKCRSDRYKIFHRNGIQYLRRCDKPDLSPDRRISHCNEVKSVCSDNGRMRGECSQIRIA